MAEKEPGYKLDENVRERLVSSLVDADVIGIMVWHIDGQIFDCNDTLLRMIGYEREDVTSGSLRWTDITPPDWRPGDEKPKADVRATGIFHAYEKEYVRKDGSRVPVLLGGGYFDHAGDRGVSFIIDLTDLKRAQQIARENERRYHAAQLELAHANRVATLGQLSAAVAHEVSQPLSGILTNASTCLRMLTTNPPNVEGAIEPVRRMIRDANRGSEIVARLRALFDKKDIANERVDLNEIVEETIGILHSELEKGGINLQFALTAGLPHVSGDRVQLQQVILNLVLNALDAMKAIEDRSRLLVVETGKANADTLLVTVKDSGFGIDPENLERVFEAFFSTKPGGLGLGLSVCRDIIRAHKGDLWATSAFPHGASFHFTLPLGAGAQSQE